jgi:hypothetical protein
MLRPSILTLGLLLVAVTANAQTDRRPSRSNPLANPPGMVDQMVFFDTADAWREGIRRNVALVITEPVRLVLLNENERAFPRDGTWTSPVTETAFPFTEFIPSWNVDAPTDTGIRFEVRVRDAHTKTWSPWLHMGFWGRVTSSPTRTVSFDGGVVNVDVLNLDRPADAFQIRALFQSFNLDKSVNPSLRRIAVSYSGVVEDPARRAALMPPIHVRREDWARTLEVPHIGQGSLGRPLSGYCCSPTSVTMVLDAWGREHPLLENAMAIYDPDYDIFGNWDRAVAYAGSLGLDAWVTRFRTWDQVKAQIAQGQPVIASVKIAQGDLPGVDYKGGHLIVIRGFTPDGDPVVNDPAYSVRGNGVVYPADRFAHVWFDHGGVAYIIRPPRSAARAGQE